MRLIFSGARRIQLRKDGSNLPLYMQAIPSFNSKEFSGGLVSQEDIGVLFRFIHSVGSAQNRNS